MTGGEGKVPAHLQSPAFLRSCAAQLATGVGVVVCNLYNGAPVREGMVWGEEGRMSIIF